MGCALFPLVRLLTERLLQGQEACWRWRWVVREAWVGWMVLVELEACGLRAVAVESGRTGCGSALGAQWVGLGSSVPCLLQPSLLDAPAPSHRLGSDPGLSDSDSEESVFSGLEDSGSDSTEDATASEEEGEGTSEQRALEKEMVTHSCVLAWRIPGTEELSGFLSMGSHRVGHD